MTDNRPLPLVDFLDYDKDGKPFMHGTKCTHCGATYLGPRRACSKCFARDGLVDHRVAEQGELHAFSIVHRSYPGIPVPFVSAIVDLEDGTALKGTLIDIDPTPEAVKPGLKVQVVYRVLDQKDKDGNAYVNYFFRPLDAAA